MCFILIICFFHLLCSHDENTHSHPATAAIIVAYCYANDGTTADPPPPTLPLFAGTYGVNATVNKKPITNDEFRKSIDHN